MTDFAQRRTMMVDTQVRPNEVTSYPVIEAMHGFPGMPMSAFHGVHLGRFLNDAVATHHLAPRVKG